MRTLIGMLMLLATVRSVADQVVEDTGAVGAIGVDSPFLSARVLLQQPAFTALSVDSLQG